MSVAEEKLRKLIDEVIAPRRADADEFLAYSQSDFSVESADLLYLRDQYHQQHLDFSAAGGLLPLGHNHGPTRSRIGEQLGHYGPVGPPGRYLTRWPTEYAKALAQSVPIAADRAMKVLFTADEDAAMAAAVMMVRDLSETPHCLLTFVRRWGELVDPHHALKVEHEARSRGMSVIADERYVGFGRTGRLWAQQRWGVTADITVVGGPAGAGFPFGAVIAPAEFFDRTPARLQNQAGHPAICAGGFETLRAINDPLLVHVEDAFKVITEGLSELKYQFPDVIVDHSGVGMLHFLKLQTVEHANDFVRRAREKGLVLAPSEGATITLTPPLITSELELRRGIDLMGSVCLDWGD